MSRELSIGTWYVSKSCRVRKGVLRFVTEDGLAILSYGTDTIDPQVWVAKPYDLEPCQPVRRRRSKFTERSSCA